jgi:hypothetical protein
MKQLSLFMEVKIMYYFLIIKTHVTHFFLYKVEGLRKAQTATSVLFGQDLSALSGDDIIEAFKTDANRFVQLDRASVVGAGLDQVAAITKAAKSKCKNNFSCFRNSKYHFPKKGEC